MKIIFRLTIPSITRHMILWRGWFFRVTWQHCSATVQYVFHLIASALWKSLPTPVIYVLNRGFTFQSSLKIVVVMRFFRHFVELSAAVGFLSGGFGRCRFFQICRIYWLVNRRSKCVIRLIKRNQPSEFNFILLLKYFYVIVMMMKLLALVLLHFY